MGILFNKIELFGVSKRRKSKAIAGGPVPGLFVSEYSRWELLEIRYINGTFYKILVRESYLSSKRQFTIRKMRTRSKGWIY